jgi:alanyl-tRNA synthetase
MFNKSQEWRNLRNIFGNATPKVIELPTLKCSCSGKHNDLEDVGFDTIPQPCSKCLNWSFGDYLRKEALLPWEFLN